MPNALVVDHLSVCFGKTRVLHDLSFEVEQGSCLAIVGPNGAGKTVLFRALIGSVPSNGAIRWAPATRIGYVPQKLDLERDVPITGADFLRARASLARVSAAEVALLVARILEVVGVSKEIGDSPIGALSGGQFQRLLVAFALLGNPSVLLLDEPTAGIDEPGQKVLNELVHHLQVDRGLTVLFISHEISVVYQYANNVLCLGHGRACCGPPHKILTPERLREIYGAPVEFHVHEP